MALTSTMVPLGTSAPPFALPDLSGNTVRLEDFGDQGVLVVAFVCNHCPYVQHIERELGALAKRAEATVVGICSNDAVSYPDDSIGELRRQADRAGWQFPYLVDEDQSVAAAYGAVCTPDFFVYDSERRLGYRGAFDESTPKNGNPVTGALLADAIARCGRGEGVPTPHRPSMGCGIKWRTDRAPQ
jgi:peroxiredoxin